jgi:YhcH/YjgK/YiaL family protein
MNMRSRRQFLAVSSIAVLGAGSATPGEDDPEVIAISDWKKTPKFRSISDGFDAITSGSLLKRPPGRYEIDGERLYATVTEDTTQDPAKGRFEVHHRYVDIHYLVEGREMIGSADPKSLETAKSYDEKGDAELFTLPATYRELHLLPGQCAVFFPGQAHLPGRWDPKPTKIRKIVVKVLQPR